MNRSRIRSLVFPLVSARLFLEPLDARDQGSVLELYSDWQVARWLSRVPWPFTSSSAAEMIQDSLLELDRGAGCILGARDQASGTLMGTVSLRIPALGSDPWTTDTALAILGYAVCPEHQGNGYATEAAAEVVRCAFAEIGLERLRATVSQGNGASRRVLQRLGFTVKFQAVSEIPQYGGPPRLGDTFMLDGPTYELERLLRV